MNIDDTITAISTPPGKGGIGIIRISGRISYKIGKLITGSDMDPRKAHLSKFYNLDKEMIDSGIVIFFKSPNSFTGEDIVEIQAHGSPVTLDMILDVVVKSGARLAKPGEFTERAFLNNKIDLTQAEAIADLISSNSIKAAKSATRSLQGEFSKKINDILKSLIGIRKNIEAEIDFPEESYFCDREKIFQEIQTIINKVVNVLDLSKQSILFHDGLTVGIIGKPNSGKSSLFNALMGEERAIVTKIEGTTRDTIHGFFNYNGMTIKLIDTAGIRESQDIIENKGIKLTIDTINIVDHIIILIDITNDINETKKFIKRFCKINKKTTYTYVYNKVDLIKNKSRLNALDKQILVSSKEKIGIEELKKVIFMSTGLKEENTEGILNARRRHIISLNTALECLYISKRQLIKNDLLLVAEDLKNVQKELSTITGEFYTEDLLEEIFSSFCIGK